MTCALLRARAHPSGRGQQRQLNIVNLVRGADVVFLVSWRGGALELIIRGRVIGVTVGCNEPLVPRRVVSHWSMHTALYFLAVGIFGVAVVELGGDFESMQSGCLVCSVGAWSALVAKGRASKESMQSGCLVRSVGARGAKLAG